MKHIAKKSISFILMLLLVMSFATTAEVEQYMKEFVESGTV